MTTTRSRARDARGLAAIAVSHPHFFSWMIEWGRAFGAVPVFLHADDLAWVTRPDETVPFWEVRYCRITAGEGLTPSAAADTSPAAPSYTGGPGPAARARYSPATPSGRCRPALGQLYVQLSEPDPARCRRHSPHRRRGRVTLRSPLWRVVRASSLSGAKRGGPPLRRALPGPYRVLSAWEATTRGCLRRSRRSRRTRQPGRHRFQ